MKHISVVIPGADESAETQDLEVEPGTTAADALRSINKDQTWQLQRRGKDGGFVAMAATDSLDTIADGEKLFAVPKDIVVGG